MTSVANAVATAQCGLRAETPGSDTTTSAIFYNVDNFTLCRYADTAETASDICTAVTWPDVRDRVTLKLAVMVHGRASQYLTDHCASPSRPTPLCSTERSLLHIARHWLTTYGRRSFAVRLEQSPGPCPQPECHLSRFRAVAKNIYVHTELVQWAHWGGGFMDKLLDK